MNGLDLGIGVLVSIVVAGYKWFMNQRGVSRTEALAAVAVFSVVAAVVVTFLQMTAFWPTLLQIVISAGAFYAYIVKQIEAMLKAQSTTDTGQASQ